MPASFFSAYETTCVSSTLSTKQMSASFFSWSWLLTWCSTSTSSAAMSGQPAAAMQRTIQRE